MGKVPERRNPRRCGAFTELPPRAPSIFRSTDSAGVHHRVGVEGLSGEGLRGGVRPFPCASKGNLRWRGARPEGTHRARPASFPAPAPSTPTSLAAQSRLPSGSSAHGDVAVEPWASRRAGQYLLVDRLEPPVPLTRPTARGWVGPTQQGKRGTLVDRRHRRRPRGGMDALAGKGPRV